MQRTPARFPIYVFILLLCAFAGVASAKPRQWTFIDLGVLPGFTSSVARAVNNHGQVVGFNIGFAGLGDTGFLWEDGSMIDFGIQDPLRDSRFAALDINDRGQVVGNFGLQVWSWKEGVGTFLGARGRACCIDKFGDIAVNDGHAALWEDGAPTDLGTLGGDFSEALSMNDRGQVVGNAEVSGGALHAFLWDDGVMSDLSFEIGVGACNHTLIAANGIDNHGRIVGSSANSCNDHATAVLYDGRMHLLLDNAAATAINDHGDVVGVVYGEGLVEAGAFLFSDGKVTRIDRMPEVEAAGFTQVRPVDINDHGWIVGSGREPGPHHFTHGFLLIPKGGEGR
jgi:probable HAF family extracellular repeat protein